MNTIDTTTLTSLERAVYGTNLINRLTIQNLRKVLPQLETYKGKKICLANGSKAKIFDIELLSYTDNNGQHLRTYIHFEFYGSVEKVSLKQDVTVKDKNYAGGGYGVTYFKNDIHIGTMINGVLTEIETLQQIEYSYGLGVEFCAKKVKETKDRIKELKEEVSKLESSIYQFKNL
jgi:hypothetical protein